MLKKRARTYRHQILCLLFGLSITLSSVLIAWTYYNTPSSDKDSNFYTLINSLHTASIDLRMKIRGPKIEEKDLLVIGIDERSLQAFGRWPWDRSKIAALVENLFENGVKAIALDITFPEPSNEDIQKILKEIPNVKGLNSENRKALTQYSKTKRAEFNSDKKLAKTFEKYSSQLIAASVYDIPRFTYSAHQHLCLKVLHSEFPATPQWEVEGYDFIHLINPQIRVIEELPTTATDLIKTKLGKIKETKAKLFCSNKTECQSLSTAKKSEMVNMTKKAQLEYCSNWLSNSDGKSLLPALLPVDNWSLNTPQIQNSIRLTGFLNVHPDLDGTVREIPLLVRTGNYLLPSLSLRLAMTILEADGGQIILDQNALSPSYFEVNELELTKEAEPLRKVEVDQKGFTRINFQGPRYTFPHVSAKEILEREQRYVYTTQLTNESGQLSINRNSKKPKSYLKGKSVIIGATAPGLYDLRVTPFDENYPGVEAHLTVVDNILRGDNFSNLRSEPPLMLLILLALGVSLSTALSLLGATSAFIISLGTLLGLSILDYMLFFNQGKITTFVFPLFLSLTLYISLTIFRYFTEERKKKKLRGTFEKYVSPSIVKEILEHPDNLKLGGRKEHMTVFFSDVRGFTTISESLDPSDLSDLLNYYLTPMTELVFKNNGTLDKYMGDAIMAFFGAPVSSSTHAEDAAKCALQNIERLRQINDELKKQDLPEIDIGIGLNTGDMSVGNMGSETVRNYTVMGDAVNLGARLEGINKQYGTRIIISEFTEKELPKSFVRREIDLVKVKGKDLPVRIFELMQEGSLDQEQEQLLSKYKNGYKLYHQQKWHAAIEEFEKSKDSVSELYIRRCKEFIETPPPKDWDGVFVMTTK